MKGKATLLLLSAAVLIGLCVTAHAAGPQPDNYIVFKPGIFYPQGDIDELGTGFNGEIAYGRRFHPNAALEIGTGYIGTESHTDSAVVYGYACELKKELYAVPITVAIKGIAPINKDFDVYAIGGLGAYYANAKITFSVAGIGSDSTSDSKWVLGGFAGVGANYNFAGNCFIGIEGKYLWTDEVKMSGNIAGVPVEAKFNMEGIQGLATIGFRF